MEFQPSKIGNGHVKLEASENTILMFRDQSCM